jgi:hypothetical protein
MWRDILETNHAQIDTGLDVFAHKLDGVREELRARAQGNCGEMRETEQIFAEANRLAKAANERAVRWGVIRS